MVIQFQIILKIFTLLLFSDLIRQFVPKIFYSISKKSNGFVDLLFEICLDSKFPFCGEILKKCLP